MTQPAMSRRQIQDLRGSDHHEPPKRSKQFQWPASAHGARPRKNGQFTYRYHPIGGKPINLGRDKQLAIRMVLDMNMESPDRGTVSGLWRIYQDSADWLRLSKNTQRDYTQCSTPLLAVFGEVSPDLITPAHCARYLRVERKAAPIRANREMALLSNLMNLAIERGDISANPCKQVRRNHESPREEAPETGSVSAFLEWAWSCDGQTKILAGMAEFAALSGNRRAEFLGLHWTQVGETEIRLQRAKQRGRKVVESLTISPSMAELLTKLRELASDSRHGAVFRNRAGNCYTDAGFKAMWSKLMAKAIEEKVIEKRFTFHDLRAFFVTKHKAETGGLPDLHANPATTARVYDRTKVVKRGSL